MPSLDVSAEEQSNLMCADPQHLRGILLLSREKSLCAGMGKQSLGVIS